MPAFDPNAYAERNSVDRWPAIAALHHGEALRHLGDPRVGLQWIACGRGHGSQR